MKRLRIEQEDEEDEKVEYIGNMMDTANEKFKNIIDFKNQFNRFVLQRKIHNGELYFGDDEEDQERILMHVKMERVIHYSNDKANLLRVIFIYEGVARFYYHIYQRKNSNAINRRLLKVTHIKKYSQWRDVEEVLEWSDVEEDYLVEMICFIEEYFKKLII